MNAINLLSNSSSTGDNVSIPLDDPVLQEPAPKDPVPEDQVTNDPVPNNNDEEKLKKKAEKLKRRVNKYKTRLCRANKKIRRKSTHNVTSITAAIKPFLPPRAFNFFADQIKYYQVKKKTGLRFTERSKTFALQMKGISKKGYKLLRKMFILPCLTTIANILNKIKIEVGFHPSVLEALKEKASNMSNVEKRVIMSFDEMTLSASLKYDSHADQIEGFEDYGGGMRSSALADHSSVFMCRGLKRNWKQPFGYFLSNGCIPGEILSDKIKDGLRHLISTGLNPVAVVMDQGSNNQKAAKLLGVTEEQPYFQLDGRRILLFWDTPHLAKVSLKRLY